MYSVQIFRFGFQVTLYNVFTYYLTSGMTYSVKRSDVTGNRFEWEFKLYKLYKTPSPILHCISLLGDNNGGQGYWVSQNYIENQIMGYTGWDHF